MAAKPAKKTPAKKTAAKAEKPAKVAKEKIERIVQNDVTRPKDGTTTGKVWAAADKITAGKPKGQYATRAEVMEACTKQDIPEATVATQFQRWRTFNDVPKAPPAVKAEKPAKPAKAAKAPAKKAPSKKAAAAPAPAAQ